MFCLLPRSPYGLDKVFGSYDFSAREVSCCNLCVDLDTRVHWDQVFYTGSKY